MPSTRTERLISQLVEDVVAANRILSTEHVVDAFGHVSFRHPTNPDHYFIARALAPELITVEDIMELTLMGEVCNGDWHKPYLEKDIHGAIYEARPDVHAVIHSHCHAVLPYTVINEPLRPIVHTCATIGLSIPVWDAQHTFGDTSLLVSNMDMGRDLARTLDDNTTVLMRGHGCTVVGRSIREAVYTAVYLQLNARLQMEASRFPPINFLKPEEVKIICKRLAEAKPNEGYDRAWEYWCRHADVRPRIRDEQSA